MYVTLTTNEITKEVSEEKRVQTCREDFLDLEQPRRPEKSRLCEQGGAYNISFMEHKSQDNWCKTPTWNW